MTACGYNQDDPADEPVARRLVSLAAGLRPDDQVEAEVRALLLGLAAGRPAGRDEPGPPPSPYLTVDEAAARLRRTRQAVYALVKRGRLHPLPGSPGRLLFTPEQIERFLKTRRRR